MLGPVVGTGKSSRCHGLTWALPGHQAARSPLPPASGSYCVVSLLLDRGSQNSNTRTLRTKTRYSFSCPSDVFLPKSYLYCRRIDNDTVLTLRSSCSFLCTVLKCFQHMLHEPENSKSKLPNYLGPTSLHLRKVVWGKEFSICLTQFPQYD